MPAIAANTYCYYPGIAITDSYSGFFNSYSKTDFKVRRRLIVYTTPRKRISLIYDIVKTH